MPEVRVEALALAMALAPGVYARNRMFAFFADEGVRRARARAATLRGVARQLGRAAAVDVVHGGGGGGSRAWTLRYAIAELRLTRVVELSASELSALRVMCARSGVPALPCEDDDRARVEAALARLLDDERSAPLSRAARGSVAPEAAAPRSTRDG